MRRFIGLILLVVLAAGASAAAQDQAVYRAGTAKVKITPAAPGYLLAYDKHQKAEGVESDLWVRSLALEDSEGQKVVLVSADILGFNPTLARAIREDARKRFGLKDGQLLLAASHTHNGPVLPESPSLEIYHDFSEEEAKGVYAYAEVFRGHVLDAIGKALGAMRPARLSWGRGQATFGTNRRKSLNPNGPTDPDVPVLSVDSADGRPIAVVFTYACHLTTVMASHFVKYSADYAGVAAEELERRRPGATALFVAGCGGDINPEPMGKVEYVPMHGRALAEAVAARTRTDGRPASRARPVARRLPRNRAPPRQGAVARTAGEIGRPEIRRTTPPCASHAPRDAEGPITLCGSLPNPRLAIRVRPYARRTLGRSLCGLCSPSQARAGPRADLGRRLCQPGAVLHSFRPRASRRGL